MNIIYGLGSALGAAIGGAMAEALGWRWEFGIQVPPLLVCLLVSAIAIPADLGVSGERKSVMQAVKEFDVKGSILLTTAVCFLILGLVSRQRLPALFGFGIGQGAYANLEASSFSPGRVSVATSFLVSGKETPSPYCRCLQVQFWKREEGRR